MKDYTIKMISFREPLTKLSKHSKLTLFDYCENCNISEIDKILRSDPDKINSLDDANNTPLMIACIFGHSCLVDYFLASFSNICIEHKNKDGLTAFVIARMFDHAEIEKSVKILEKTNKYSRYEDVVILQ